MKNIVILIIILSAISCGRGSNSHKNNDDSDYTNKLIGVWEFVETTDTNGNKLNSYQGSFGTVQATGPKLIYNKDKSYVKVFTPKNSDTGFWKFNSETSTIEHDLYVDSTSSVFPYLLKDKLIEKKSDGKYYELIEDKVLKIEQNKIFIDERGLINVYKRIK
jgi:hypothetical protein